MEYYLSSLGQSSQPALAARSCHGTGYLVGSEGQTGSLLPTRSEWGSRQAIATAAAASNNSQRTSALGFEEGGWNSEPVLQQEPGGMEGGRVVAPPPPPPPPPHPPFPSLAIYPERPGVQDCPFYLRTGTCGFGQQCKFNHPPNGRASAAGYQSFSTKGKLEYPERPGQPECQYYMKTGTCKFGATCKYHHPCLKLGSNPNAYQPPRPPLNSLGYPLRPGEKECAYYMRNRVCRFGVTCRFHHPQLPPTNGAGLMQPRAGPLPHPLVNPSPPHLPFQMGSLQPWQVRSLTTARFPVFPHQQVQYLPPHGCAHGSSGVAAAPSSSPPHVFSQHPPHQQGPRPPQHANANPSQQHSVPGPPYYYTTPGGPGSAAGPLSEQNAAGGSGGGMATAVPPYFAGHGTHFMPSVPCGPMGMAAQAGGPTAAAGQGGTAGVGGMVYLQQTREFPERPGQPECTFYMRTGDCKYGMSCRYHHPKDRGVPAAQCALSSMGLPLRPGQPQCSFYTRYGVCKFGHTCKFDHPVGLDYSPSASSLVDLPVAPVSYTGGTSPLANQSGDGRNEAGEMHSSTSQERQQQLLIGEGDEEREKQDEDGSSQVEDMGGKKTTGGGSATADGGEAGGPPVAAQANAAAVAGVVSGLGGNGGTHQSAGGGMYCSSMTAQTGGNGSGSSTG
ncbi:hypothetical protein CBR_g28558 [Chara braunii]|uniref:C3H1-type domain-containing protein n=1 Tax=Chara braunii TaxID=69332 RepID=A0A388JWI3_CHABU|nr:hypothetical protein CBR_g28558 [Chara braunii]|eukprot:GBG62082.1 hypothetical protein CBR_g28558 [Chara braunii]